MEKEERLRMLPPVVRATVERRLHEQELERQREAKEAEKLQARKRHHWESLRRAVIYFISNSELVQYVDLPEEIPGNWNCPQMHMVEMKIPGLASIYFEMIYLQSVWDRNGSQFIIGGDISRDLDDEVAYTFDDALFRAYEIGSQQEDCK